jgi:hypothetical protein
MCKSRLKTEFVVPIKYLVLIALAILVGLGIHFFPDNIIHVSMLVAWVFIIAAVFAVGEKIVGRS